MHLGTAQLKPLITPRANSPAIFSLKTIIVMRFIFKILYSHTLYWQICDKNDVLSKAFIS